MKSIKCSVQEHDPAVKGFKIPHLLSLSLSPVLFQ